MSFYQLESILYLCIFTTVFYIHGRLLTQGLLQARPWPEKFFINTTIGLGLVLFILFFIALTQLLTITFVSIIFSIVPVLSIYKYLSSGKYNISLKKVYQGIIEHAGLVVVILLLLIPDTYGVFLPETGSDAMRYHLPYARLYVENQGLVVNEFLRYPVFSHNINLAYSLGYLYQGDFQGGVLARLFNVFFLILLAIGLYSLTANRFNKIMAFFASAILIKVKMLRVLMISAYVDIGLAVFIFACIYFIYLWQKDQQDKWLYLAALMLGLALGTKYLALVWLLPITFWVFVTNKSWKNTYQFFILALLIGSPWYIRNMIISGNPIHPFAQSFFGYWLWQPEDMIEQTRDLLDTNGVAKTIWNLVKLPWLMATEYSFKISPLNWFLAAGIPLMVFAVKMGRFFIYMAVFILFNLIFWFYTSQIMRYFIVLLPMLAIFAAYPLGLMFTKISKHKFFMNKQIQHVIAISLIGYASYSIIVYYHKSNQQKPLPESDVEWQQSLYKNNKDYQFSKILNDRQAKRVFKLGKAQLQNTFTGEVLGDWFGSANMMTFIKSVQRTQDIKIQMDKFQVKYLLVSKQEKWFNRINLLLAGNPNFDKLIESNESILYVLKDTK
ncbi:hypothetical protein MNBD_GAMMA01-898 [hydrothermal vent metagenome]|uniref:Glycosyltransferase RgtA/B/C/D-like domain-containing protein n=1 Tax=hydrothermal vent metagenome TaxID=652676 RepID=A0A3B0VRH6_9ZZZZ